MWGIRVTEQGINSAGEDHDTYGCRRHRHLLKEVSRGHERHGHREHEPQANSATDQQALPAGRLFSSVRKLIAQHAVRCHRYAGLCVQRSHVDRVAAHAKQPPEHRNAVSRHDADDGTGCELRRALSAQAGSRCELHSRESQLREQQSEPPTFQYGPHRPSRCPSAGSSHAMAGAQRASGRRGTAGDTRRRVARGFDGEERVTTVSANRLRNGAGAHRERLGKTLTDIRRPAAALGTSQRAQGKTERALGKYERTLEKLLRRFRETDDAPRATTPRRDRAAMAQFTAARVTPRPPNARVACETQRLIQPSRRRTSPTRWRVQRPKSGAAVRRQRPHFRSSRLIAYALRRFAIVASISIPTPIKANVAGSGTA